MLCVIEFYPILMYFLRPALATYLWSLYCDEILSYSTLSLIVVFISCSHSAVEFTYLSYESSGCLTFTVRFMYVCLYCAFEMKIFPRFTLIQIDWKWIISRTLKNRSVLILTSHSKHFRRIFYVLNSTALHEYILS